MSEISETLPRCPECNGWVHLRRWVHNAAFIGDQYQGWPGSHRPCEHPFHESPVKNR